MLKSDLCEYSDVYILISGTITITANEENNRTDGRNREVIFRNYAPFVECTINLLNHAKHLYILMPMFSLIEHTFVFIRKMFIRN